MVMLDLRNTRGRFSGGFGLTLFPIEAALVMLLWLMKALLMGWLVSVSALIGVGWLLRL